MRGSAPPSGEGAVAPGRPRLFVALPLPKPLRTELFAASGVIARELPAGRFRRVPPDNLHLTLRFFGPERGLVERKRIAALLRDRLEASSAEPPVLRAERVSAFGSLRRARVVWVGLSETGSGGGESARLVHLQRAAEAVAREIGLDPGSGPFVPHVTIGRLRVPARIPARALAALPAASPGTAWSSPFTVRACILLASVLTPGGARYRQLASFPLDGSQRIAASGSSEPEANRNSASRSGPSHA